MRKLIGEESIVDKLKQRTVNWLEVIVEELKHGHQTVERWKLANASNVQTCMVNPQVKRKIVI